MNGNEFRAWRERLGMTPAQAAAKLGRSLGWVYATEAKSDQQLDRMIELACKQIESKND